MNKLLIQKMSFLALIVGFVGGIFVVVPIPVINLLVFLFLISLSSAGIYLYLKKNNQIGIFDPKSSALYGGVLGFITFCGFSCSMLPLACLANFVNDLWFHKMVWFSIFKTIFSDGFFAGIIFLGMFLFLIGLLSAVINAFFMMIIVAIFQSFDENKPTEDDINVDIEIK